MDCVAALLRLSGLSPAEARALLAHELGVPREAIVAHPEREVAGEIAQRFLALAARRAAGEPLAYVLGEREFYGRAFAVDARVLVPRPETELLVERALEHLRGRPRPRVLDLGTGSGCVAITLALERADAEVVAVDLSAPALAVASDNAARLHARVSFLASDWFAAVESRFDVIVANPPYVAEGDGHLADLQHEPQTALVAAENGLASLKRIIDDGRSYLATDGWLVVEHGYDQGAAVRDLYARAGFTAITTSRDAANLERTTEGCS